VQITGRLNLGGLTLRCPLELHDCFLGGRLDLAKAKAPDISLRGSYLGQPLSARGLHLDQTLNLKGFHCHGSLKLAGAHIGGQLDCDGARLTNPNGTALNADRLTVEGGLFLRGAEVAGAVWLAGARIGRLLTCTEARFSNPNGRVLSAGRLAVDGDLHLRRAEVAGEAWLAGVDIGGELDCDGARFSNPNGTALHLAYASATEAVLMRPASLEGSIDLTAARVGAWYDDKPTWPAALRLEGFVYEAIDAPNITPRQRLDWLRRHQGGYAPQPYEQLAAVYRRAGNHEGARTVAIAKQQARRAQAKRWWVRWPSRAWSGFLRWTIGYGYRPALALPWLAGLFAVGWLVFDHAYQTHLRPAGLGSEQPEFNPARYTLDLLLPVANLKQRDAFVPHGYAAWWAFGLSFAGWLLAVVVVAGLTGVFKRD
jgi:hypothetical protein